MPYYLTPTSPTSATSIELGDDPIEARHTLGEMGYSETDADQLFDEWTVDGGSDTWTLTID